RRVRLRRIKRSVVSAAGVGVRAAPRADAHGPSGARIEHAHALAAPAPAALQLAGSVSANHFEIMATAGIDVLAAGRADAHVVAGGHGVEHALTLRTPAPASLCGLRQRRGRQADACE